MCRSFKSRSSTLCVTMLAIGIGAAPLRAQTPATAPATQAATQKSPMWSNRRALVEVSQNFPKPAADMKSAGTRSKGDWGGVLTALSPHDVGKTSQPSPRLYWHLSDPTNLPVIISICRVGDSLPVKRWRVDELKSAGFHTVDLARQGIELAPGQTYEWIVAVVQDADRRSKDVVVSGFIQREPAPSNISAPAIDPLERAERSFAAGFAYDGIDALLGAIESNPGDAAAGEFRAELLASLNLQEASTSEMRGR